MARFCNCSLAHLAVWNEQVSTMLSTPPHELTDTRERSQEWCFCLGLNMWRFMICWVFHLKCSRTVCHSAWGNVCVCAFKRVFIIFLREMDFLSVHTYCTADITFTLADKRSKGLIFAQWKFTIPNKMKYSSIPTSPSNPFLPSFN